MADTGSGSLISIKPLFGFLAYHNISLKELARRAGVSYASLMKMKKTGEFSFSVIDKICTCLNIGIKDVMRYEEAQDI